MHPLIQRLFSLPGRSSTTFEAFRKLDARLGFPHKAFRTIHIGGTNGKGSVATKVAHALQLQGYRVGLYTSPHLVDFRERIRINGEMISESQAIAWLGHLFQQVQEELSFFDLLTAMAFLHFQQAQVDWAVIEVGLGGRLDATNVIHPEAAAITSIGFDHMEILGNTLAEIAFEKGGIAKRGIPLVVGSSAAPYFPDAIAVPKAPLYDLENQALAKALLAQVGVHDPKGLDIRPPCRLERQGDLIFDVAHNLHGFQRLMEALDHFFPNQTLHFGVAFSKNKQWRPCIDAILSKAKTITALRGAHPKLIPPEEIDAHQIADPKDFARTAAYPTVVCGSFYIMEEFFRRTR